MLDTTGWKALIWDLDGTLTAPGAGLPSAGIETVLAAWAARDVPMAVATSASTRAARRLVDDLGWSGRFDHVAGTGPGVEGKDDVIAEALLGLGRPLPEGARGAVVVGDGPNDMAAAVALGILAVGVAWGSTPAHVLRAAGADHVVDDPAALLPR